MSRTNPFKKKRRVAKETILFFVEGADEKNFFDYLKSLFTRDSGIAIRVKNAFGGGADAVLESVLRQSGYHSVYCVYDVDTNPKKKNEDAVDKAGVKRLPQQPCFEAFLLEILEEKKYNHHLQCAPCKKRFQKEYLRKSKAMTKDDCAKLFSKSLLEKRAKSIPLLAEVITIFSGKK